MRILNLKHPQLCSYGGCQGIFNATLCVIPWQTAYGPQIRESLCPKRKIKQLTKLNKMEFWVGHERLRSLNITDNTSNDKFKRTATFPGSNHTVLSRKEYLEHLIERPNYWLNWQIYQIHQNCWVGQSLGKYNTPDCMYGDTIKVMLVSMNEIMYATVSYNHDPL